jgi:hypothetical protein
MLVPFQGAFRFAVALAESPKGITVNSRSCKPSEKTIKIEQSTTHGVDLKSRVRIPILDGSCL